MRHHRGQRRLNRHKRGHHSRRLRSLERAKTCRTWTPANEGEKPWRVHPERGLAVRATTNQGRRPRSGRAIPLARRRRSRRCERHRGPEPGRRSHNIMVRSHLAENRTSLAPRAAAGTEIPWRRSTIPRWRGTDRAMVRCGRAHVSTRTKKCRVSPAQTIARWPRPSAGAAPDFRYPPYDINALAFSSPAHSIRWAVKVSRATAPGFGSYVGV